MKTIFRSLFTDISGQILFQLVMILVIPFYLEFTSQTEYGYWLTITSIVAWVSLTDLGIGLALTKRMLELVSNDSGPEEKRNLINTGFFTFLLAGLLFLCLGAAILPFLSEWLNVPEKNSETFDQVYILAVIAGAISLPVSTFTAIIESFHRLTQNRLIEIFSSLFGVGMGCALIFFLDIGIIGLPLGILFRSLSNILISFWYSKKIYHFTINLSFFRKKYLKEMLSFGGYLQLSRIAYSIATSTDNIIITAILGASLVVPYNMTMKLPLFFGMVVASKISAALFARLTELLAKEEMEKLKESMTILLRILIRLAILATVIVFFINKPFVELWVGEKNFGGNGLNLVFAYWILFETIIRASTMIIYSFGNMKPLAMASILEAVSNLLLSIILGKLLGLVGVALATAISRSISIGIYLPRFLLKKDLIDLRSLKQFRWDIIKSLPTVFVAWTTFSLLKESSPLFLITLIIILAVITNLVSFEYSLIRSNLKGDLKLSDFPKKLLNNYVSQPL